LAEYSGDANDEPSISAPLIQAVNAPPSLGKVFGAPSISLNGSTTLTFTVNLASLTGVGFTDTLPAGLVVASPSGLTGACGGGTITAIAGSGSISLSGATLVAGATCTFVVNVSSTSAGTKNNTTGAVTSNEGGAGATASASLDVAAAIPMLSPLVFLFLCLAIAVFGAMRLRL